MYPLDLIYGPRSLLTFRKEQGFPNGLKDQRQCPDEIWEDDSLQANRYEELVEMVSFLSVMNKRHLLFFRGQGSHIDPIPAIFRPKWVSPSGNSYELKPNSLKGVWTHLQDGIAPMVREVCSRFPMPRPRTLEMFKEAVWSVAQHYELWPTPLIDVTPNLRIAASFALWGGRFEGNLYVVTLTPSTNSVTYDSDQHIVLARLQAVCPPIAKRPHYQDGYLVGRFPFDTPFTNTIDRHPEQVSSLRRRLVARIKLNDIRRSTSEIGKSETSSFWSSDFPFMSATSLMPLADQDELRKAFDQRASDIDKAMKKYV